MGLPLTMNERDRHPHHDQVARAVRPAYRGRDIGSALVERRLADGRRSHLINVGLANDGAQRLYRRLGFRDEVYRRRQYERERDA